MKILIVEDDRTLADILKFSFSREGFEVIQSFTGTEALDAIHELNPEIILMDLNIPVPDGFKLCEIIRKTSDTPIVILTVRDSEEDIIHGLDLGADDYITKPFSPRQLMARVNAVLRRADHPSIETIRRSGNYVLDCKQHTLTINGSHPIQLTKLECGLLDCLFLNAGHSVHVNQIIDNVWGINNANPESVRQLVHRLRKKIEDASEETDFIKTASGHGYIIEV